MSFEFKTVSKGFFICLILVIQWTESSIITEETNGNPPKNDTLRQDSWGIPCGNRICGANQICGEQLICHCQEGFKNYSDNCLPCADENESCLTHSDCSGMLLCINGKCRKPGPNGDFISLAKISLIIALTIIIIAVFGHVIKCLLGYKNLERYQRRNNNGNVNTSISAPFRYPTGGPHRPYIPENDKPPSYEECVNSSQRTPQIVDPPPPYVISSNVVSPTTDNLHSAPRIINNQPNLGPTPLNAISLGIQSNPEVRPNQVHSDIK